jgi:hypothetical protein
MMKGQLFVSLLVMESCAVREPEEVGAKETEKVVDAPGAKESVAGTVSKKCELSAPDLLTTILPRAALPKFRTV